MLRKARFGMTGCSMEGSGGMKSVEFNGCVLLLQNLWGKGGEEHRIAFSPPLTVCVGNRKLQEPPGR